MEFGPRSVSSGAKPIPDLPVGGILCSKPESKEADAYELRRVHHLDDSRAGFLLEQQKRIGALPLIAGNAPVQQRDSNCFGPKLS